MDNDVFSVSSGVIGIESNFFLDKSLGGFSFSLDNDSRTFKSSISGGFNIRSVESSDVGDITRIDGSSFNFD